VGILPLDQGLGGAVFVRKDHKASFFWTALLTLRLSPLPKFVLNLFLRLRTRGGFWLLRESEQLSYFKVFLVKHLDSTSL